MTYPTEKDVYATKVTLFWHTDERTINLFRKVVEGTLQPGEFCVQLLTIKDDVELEMLKKPVNTPGITFSDPTDEHEQGIMG